MFLLVVLLVLDSASFDYEEDNGEEDDLDRG
jgi:hypothetical protein